MSKFTGIKICIGATRDEVQVHNNGAVTVYDRAAMRKNGSAKLQGTLRRAVVEAVFPSLNDKDKARNRRANAQKHKEHRHGA